jgi:hypothetical protein
MLQELRPEEKFPFLTLPTSAVLHPGSPKVLSQTTAPVQVPSKRRMSDSRGGSATNLAFASSSAGVVTEGGGAPRSSAGISGFAGVEEEGDDCFGEAAADPA